MKIPALGAFLGGCASLLLFAAPPPAQAANQTTLSVYAAGTLAPPFRQLDQLFEKLHPGVTVQPIFAGSVKLAKRVTELGHVTDVYASA
ncbi:MAG TPA: substrate-binding domain-containing protein, partial [Acidiphilium sp.]